MSHCIAAYGPAMFASESVEALTGTRSVLADHALRTADAALLDFIVEMHGLDTIILMLSVKLAVCRYHWHNYRLWVQRQTFAMGSHYLTPSGPFYLLKVSGPEALPP